MTAIIDDFTSKKISNCTPALSSIYISCQIPKITTLINKWQCHTTDNKVIRISHTELINTWNQLGYDLVHLQDSLFITIFQCSCKLDWIGRVQSIIVTGCNFQRELNNLITATLPRLRIGLSQVFSAAEKQSYKVESGKQTKYIYVQMPSQVKCTMIINWLMQYAGLLSNRDN